LISTPTTALIRFSGDGATTELFGDIYTVKVAGPETGGAIAVIEATLAPHSGGTPLHVNTLEDENYYVLEGTMTFRLGDCTFEAPAGSFVHIPRGVVHTHWNASDGTVRMLGLPTPAGFEAFFADFATLMMRSSAGGPARVQVAALYERYGLQVVGPSPYAAR
jgi:quercetin dioxygenase-like cupin family protein